MPRRMQYAYPIRQGQFVPFSYLNIDSGGAGSEHSIKRMCCPAKPGRARRPGLGQPSIYKRRIRRMCNNPGLCDLYKCRQPADMVRVMVCDDNCGNSGRGVAQAAHFFSNQQFFAFISRIYERQFTACVDQIHV